jgi:ABC-2 type transport system ATP-binding protein
VYEKSRLKGTIMTAPLATREQARPARQPRDGLAIETHQLVKRFGDRAALCGVTLAVPAGMVYGLLGPNGAGKTTTVRILATLLTSDSGWARVAGHEVTGETAAVRRAIALAGQSATVDEDLTGRENLVFLARLAGLRRAAAKDRAAQLLAAFGLEDAAARQARAYSGGMRRRLDLAASLISRAQVYFLDEPTTGLDPAGRADVHQVIRSLVADGATVLLTTQYLDEADQLAARIAVIDRGTVIAEGTPGQLKAAGGSGTLRIKLADPAQRPQASATLARLLHSDVHQASDPLVLTAAVPAGRSTTAGSEHAAAAVAGLARAGVTVTEFALGQPSLDEAFLTLTSQPAHGPQARTEAPS